MKIKTYLPEKILTNEELENEFPGYSAKKIEKNIGIKQRHISEEDETALEMAIKVSESLLSQEDKLKIDFILFCSQSPDYYLPSSACILQDKLGLSTNVGALDYNLSTSGFIYGLALAKGLLKANIASYILLIMSDTFSKYLHPKDKGNRCLFGDAASAILLDKSDMDKIYEFVLGTDGRGWNNLIVPNGGLKHRYDKDAEDWIDENGALRNDNYLYMNGPEVFNFTIDAVPKLIQQVLLKNNCSLEDLDYVIFHQANQYMLQYLRELIGIPENKFYLDLKDIGNTASSTIPIALEKCLNDGTLITGNKVLLAGFGVGYSYGATIITI